MKHPMCLSGPRAGVCLHLWPLEATLFYSSHTSHCPAWLSSKGFCPEEEVTKESSLENKGQLGSPVQGLSPHPHTPISSTRLGLMEGLRVGPGHPDPGRGHPSVGVTETLELKNGNNNTLGPWCLAMPGATLATLGSH